MSVEEHNKKVRDSLKPGDMVEIPRGIYSHWAIYIGNDKIVHKIKKKKEDDYYIQIGDFLAVAADSKAMKNNSKDAKYSPFTPDEIVKRAMDMVENGQGDYNLVNHNCEHFASYVRYGKEVSDQIDSHMKLVGGAIGPAATR